MEIHQTEPILTFYPDAENNIEIQCPECASRKKMDASEYQGQYRILKVKCPCGCYFKCAFDFRKSYRMRVSLAGEYTILKTGKSGDMLIENLSLDGAGFANMSSHDFSPGEELELRFRLNDDHHTELRKKVKVIFVKGRSIRCEFLEKNSYEKSLGFYLRHLRQNAKKKPLQQAVS